MTNASTGQVTDKPKTSAREFMRETKREIDKVTWPSRKEVVVTTFLIIAFALVTGVFFLIVDWVLGYGVSHLLGMQS
ncbi:MAG: preprotein translocase subunit SecE [Alphaproteobacteria bacterium]|nr:preprotein translocase subunit SecE [Alphaproteobacteria bacterium]